MNRKVSLQGMWLVLAAFFVGRCQVFGVYPLAVGFFSAVCMAGKHTVLCYSGIMLAIGMNMSVMDLGRYGLILLAAAFITGMRNRMDIRHDALFFSFMMGLVTITADLVLHFIMDGGMSVTTAFLEGALVFSSAMIYRYAIRIIKDDYVKIATENEAAISVIALAATVLYGMPVTVWGGVVVAEAFGIFSILFATYKFGFGLGMAWTVICGSVVAYMTSETVYLSSWMLITLAGYALQCLVRGGRFVFAAIYVAVYFGFGMFFYDSLIEEESMKALASAVFLFLLLPSGLLLQVDGKVTSGALAENSSEWGKLVIGRLNNLAAAFKRIEYTLAGNVNTGIGLHDVGELIEGFTNQLEQEVPLRKTVEAKIIESLSAKGAGVKNLVLLKNRDERYEIYITLRMNRGRLLTADAVRKIVERETGLQLVLKEESRTIVSRNYDIICMQEKPAFQCITAVRRMSRYAGEISGDNFYIGNIKEGYRLIMISDGMGNGEAASLDSSSLIEMLEELIAAGFEQDISIRLVNSYLSDKNKGERFSTLDMLLLDLHTGYGKIYKQGAATTYVKRGEWMEMIKSTSLPVGVIDGAVCEHCSKKFYDKDMIVMVSDGILESIIFENKEDYMRELLRDADTDDPEELVSYVAEQIVSQGGNRLCDDATIIACKLVKSL